MGVVNVIGCGLAGLSAALTLAESGTRVRLVSAQPSERAQSVLAEGGINAALDLMGERDTARDHYLDTMAGGAWLADPNAVWGLVSDAPQIVRRLEALGVPFQREDGHMVQRAFGGQRKRRTCFVRSSTGKALVSALTDAVRRHEAAGLVERMSHHELCALEVEDGRLRSTVVRDTFSGGRIRLPGPCILATGSLGGLFGGLTTGTTTNTGDATALALAAGVELANLEFIQYHPTTVAIPSKRLLVSEAARGEGGRLFARRQDGSRCYFMEERYPELGNLMPRDVVSREEMSVLEDPAYQGEVFLDLTGIAKDVWEARLSDLRDEVGRYLVLDPMCEPVPVAPGIHYSMGGILVDEHHRTNVSGLLAAGECACAYHGANRLGGNSLLGAIRGGMVAARSASDLAVPEAQEAQLLAGDTDTGAMTPSAERTMRRSLAEGMGIVRDRAGLLRARTEIEALPSSPRTTLALALVASALSREETRGAHVRADFPETREELRQTSVVALESGVPVVTFRPIPAAREGVPT